MFICTDSVYLSSITVYIVYMYWRCLFDIYYSSHCLYVLTVFIWHQSQFTLYICTDGVYLTSITVYIVYMYWRCLFDICNSSHCLYVQTFLFDIHNSLHCFYVLTVFIWHLYQFTLFICTDGVYLTSITVYIVYMYRRCLFDIYITVYIVYMYWRYLFDIYSRLHCLYVLPVFIWHL